MANFSVEWLSRSFYEERDLHVKSAALHSQPHTETEEFTKGARNQFSPTSPNNSCGYTSGSESEAADDSEEETSQQRRMRTKFTSEQISKLVEAFSKHKYLGATQRRKFAEKLNLSETQVKTWFQNRRMKLKREVQDVRPAFLSVPAALLPPLLFQHHGLGGQLPAASGFYPHLYPAVLPPHYYKTHTQTHTNTHLPLHQPQNQFLTLKQPFEPAKMSSLYTTALTP